MKLAPLWTGVITEVLVVVNFALPMLNLPKCFHTQFEQLSLGQSTGNAGLLSEAMAAWRCGMARRPNILNAALGDNRQLAFG
jgi:hypothetical protein